MATASLTIYRDDTWGRVGRCGGRASKHLAVMEPCDSNPKRKKMEGNESMSSRECLDGGALPSSDEEVLGGLATTTKGNGGQAGEQDFENDKDAAYKEAQDYIADFKAEVITDLRTPDECPENGHAIAVDSSSDAADRLFAWILSPLDVKQFHQDFCERKPVVIHRPSNRQFYQGWFGKEDVESLLASGEGLKYELNVDVTRYEDGVRSNLDAAGVVDPSVVWGKFLEGWSVRVLHPHRWNDEMFLMVSAFERYWNCVTGCNAYLTPAGAQGFSPHFDDIDAFIIQTEGRKRWKCYRPRTVEEVLPRFSSADLEQEELEAEGLVIDVVLEAGDLLYMPRGTIHQAVAESDTHSLHVTVSVGQLNSWVDFLELALPRALELAAEEHIMLRESLPRDFFDIMGVAHSEKTDTRRSAFSERVKDCMDCLALSGPWDAAADQLAVKFVKSRLPLPPSLKSRSLSAKTSNLKFTSKVQMVAPHVARLVVEDEAAVVYHALSNSREVHNSGEEGDDLQFTGSFEFPSEYAQALEELLSAYPCPISVSSISLDSKKDCLQLAKQLLEAGLLIVVG